MAGMVGASRAEHNRLSLDLQERAQPLTVSLAEDTACEPARRRMADFLAGRLLPHLDEEESVLREADQRPETRLLARAMRTGRNAITARATEFLSAERHWEAVAAVRALHSLFEFHTSVFDDILLPALIEPARR